MARKLLIALCVLLYHAPLISQEFVPCPGDPSIPIDDPNCPPPVTSPPPSGSSGSLNSSANSQWMDFDAKFVEEEIQSRESEGSETSITDKKFGVIFGIKSSTFDQDSYDEFIGFDSSMKGVFLGLDYRISPDLFIGTSVDFEQEETDIDLNLGTQDMDEYGFSLYSFFYSPSEIYFSVLARYATQDYDIEQSLSQEFSFDETYRTKGTTDGSRVNLSLGSGYDFDFDSGAGQIGINALLEFDRTNVDAHVLSNDFGSVDIEEDERTRLTLSLGSQLSKVISTSAGVFIPSAFFNWYHEFKDDPRTISGIVRADFLDIAEGPVTIVTPEPDRNYLSVDANLMVVLPRGFSAFLDYERHFARKNVEHWMLTLGGRVEF
jgi:outer membrane autotransporter protein